MSEKPISPLRRRMIEDMTVRGFGEKTQIDYIRHVKNFTIFFGRAPPLCCSGLQANVHKGPLHVCGNCERASRRLWEDV